MSDIRKIKLPNDAEYDVRDSRLDSGTSGTYYQATVTNGVVTSGKTNLVIPYNPSTTPTDNGSIWITTT